MTNRRNRKSIERVGRSCLALRLRILNRGVTGIYEKRLRPVGLKVSQMNILVLAARRGVARPAEVSRDLHMEMSTVSRTLQRMRSKGWIEIIPEDDRRAQPFRLTDRGSKLLDRSIPLWERAQKEVQKLLGDAGASALAAAIERLRRPKPEEN